MSTIPHPLTHFLYLSIAQALCSSVGSFHTEALVFDTHCLCKCLVIPSLFSPILFGRGVTVCLSMCLSVPLSFLFSPFTSLRECHSSSHCFFPHVLIYYRFFFCCTFCNPPLPCMFIVAYTITNLPSSFILFKGCNDTHTTQCRMYYVLLPHSRVKGGKKRNAYSHFASVW